MDTQKMIADIKSVCKTLEAEKKTLEERLKMIDGRLEAYHSAINSLGLTVSGSYIINEETPAQKFGRRTVLTYNGRSQTLIKWAKELRMSPEGIQYRLGHGWSVEDALSKAKISYKHPPKPKKVFVYDANNNVIRQYVGVGDASRDLNLPVTTIEKIIAKMSKEDQLRVRNYYLAYVG